MSLSRPTVFYDMLLGIAGLFAPPGKTRRRLARRFHCEAAMVPDMIVWRTAIYALTGLIALLCLRVLFIICAE